MVFSFITGSDLAFGHTDEALMIVVRTMYANVSWSLNKFRCYKESDSAHLNHLKKTCRALQS